MGLKYQFTELKSKHFNILTDKNALDYLMKWYLGLKVKLTNMHFDGSVQELIKLFLRKEYRCTKVNSMSIKGQLKLATFCFNEPFQSYQKTELVEDFFKDPIIVDTLNRILPCWPFGKDEIDKIHTEIVPCTVSSLTFFDRILDENNNIIRGEGNIRPCLEDVIDGFMVADELRKVLIDQESDNFGLFNESDRNELIFRVFQFLVLGGKWCQYEDKVTPYMDLTKMLYKDLLRVEKNPKTKEIEIKSLCLNIILINKKGVSIFPFDADHLQNFVYLIIDPVMRQVTVFAHEYGGQF